MGFVISWNPVRRRNIDHVVIAIANSFSFETAYNPPSETPNQPAAPAEPAPHIPRKVAAGTGFFVDQVGRLVTNEHVIRGCTAIEVPGKGYADIVRIDAKNDVALLKLRVPPSDVGVATFRSSPVQLAEPIAALGYPYSEILGGLNVTLGNVSSLSGLGGDVTHFQLTAAVQPGNSGGPVIDANGHVTGMVQSRLNDLAMLDKTESLPQTINFAIRYSVVASVLEAEGISAKTEALRGSMADVVAAVGPSVVQNATKFTTQVVCKQ